jgi:manganese-dependent ADP-ribose/CDP-alcohol diphosphatase
MWKKIFLIAAVLPVVFCAGGRQGTIQFGVVTDIQYYPVESLGTRYYSASLGKLNQAIAEFNREKVQFTVNLGDTIDHGIQNFDTVIPLFRSLNAPVYHILGNHDFEVQAGEEDKLLGALGLKQTYYALDRAPWRLIFLDAVELRYPFPADEMLKKETEELCLKLRAQGRENIQDGYGGLGSKQLSWLDEELEEADKSGKSALVFCHSPVLPEAVFNLWNDREVVSLLEKHPSVKAYFSGHNHTGNYAFRSGIHYLTFQGIVETADRNAFAVVALKKDAIRVKGFGREPSRTLELPSPPK